MRPATPNTLIAALLGFHPRLHFDGIVAAVQHPDVHVPRHAPPFHVVVDTTFNVFAQSVLRQLRGGVAIRFMMQIVIGSAIFTSEPTRGSGKTCLILFRAYLLKKYLTKCPDDIAILQNSKYVVTGHLTEQISLHKVKL